MAMNFTNWGNAVAAAVKTVSVPQDSFITDAQLQILWQKICEQHQLHLTANMQVSTTVAVVGVTPGGGSAGGTGAGTVS